MTERPRHTFVEHTGEVEVHIEAPSLAALFEEAARALAGVMVGDAVEMARGPDEQVEVAAGDRAALLVEWLNELVYRSETRKRVYTEARVQDVSDRALHAAIRGFDPPGIKTAVKAATLHRLQVGERNHGFFATVILDV